MLVSRVCHKIKQLLRPVNVTQHYQAWFEANGDKTFRVEYDLNENSIVFDLGGYEGQWSSDIHARYCCNIYIFEPVTSFADSIKLRFARNSKIHVFAFGLSGLNTTVKLCMGNDATSQYKDNGTHLDVVLVKASDFFAQQAIKAIDLMKVNIEGGEYELLEHLLDSGFVVNIRDIQIQFHDFVPEAERRMKCIQERLSETHYLTYSYPFVWENWRNKLNCSSDVTNHPELL